MWRKYWTHVYVLHICTVVANVTYLMAMVEKVMSSGNYIFILKDFVTRQQRKSTGNKARLHYTILSTAAVVLIL